MSSQNERGRPRREGGTLADQQAAGRADRHQRTTRRARIEQVGDEIRVTAPFSTDLRDGLRTLPGARWVPGHWAVPVEHMSEALGIVTDIYGPPAIDTPRGGRR